MKNGPRLRGSIRGWALGWAIAAALTLLAGFSSRHYAAAPTFLLALASAGFGLGALIAARAREFESERSAAGLEGVIWGTACLGMLLLWFYWAPAPPRESHVRSIHFAPALVRAFETFVRFGGMASLIGPPAIYIGTAMGGAIGGSIVGAIGESLTHFLVRHHPNG